MENFFDLPEEDNKEIKRIEDSIKEEDFKKFNEKNPEVEKSIDIEGFKKKYFENIESENKKALEKIFEEINPLGLSVSDLKKNLEKEVSNLQAKLIDIPSEKSSEREPLLEIIKEKQKNISLIEDYLETNNNLSVDGKVIKIDSDIFDDGAYWS